MKKFYRQSGFTLLELFVVTLIVAILLAVAIPSMTSLIRSNELKTSRSALSSAMAFARNAAVTQKVPIVMCASNDSATCSGATAWTNGWITYVDSDDSNTLTVADCDPTINCVLKVQDALSGLATLSGSSSWLGFDVTGGLNNTGLRSFRLCAGDAEATSDTDKSYAISISGAGSSRFTKGTTVCP